MEKLTFVSKKSTEEIRKQLQSNFDSVSGFVLNMNNENDTQITFTIRKRITYGWYMIYHNWTLVNGKLIKPDIENKTTVEINFKQHFLIKLILYSHIILGVFFMIRIVTEVANNLAKTILVCTLLLLGLLLWFIFKKKFKQDIQKYKDLISNVIKS